MVVGELSDAAVDLLFHALAAATRRGILRRCVRGEASVSRGLDIARAHFVGYSMGGAVALQLALDRPELVDRLVFAGGAAFDTSGVDPELLAVFESFDPHQLDGTRWHEAYRQVAPDPYAWTSLLVKVNQLDRAGVSLPREARSLGGPNPAMIGDSDVVRPDTPHAPTSDTVGELTDPRE